MTHSIYPTPEQEVILREHYETHLGRTFRAYDAFTLASAATQDYVIATPVAPIYSHFTLYLDGTAVTKFEVFEGATSTGGAAHAVWNANRNSPAVNTVTIAKGPTVSVTGTSIWVYSGGTSSNQSKGSAAAEFSSEWILKANTKYLIRYTSGTAGNLCNLQLNWYEATYP